MKGMCSPFIFYGGNFGVYRVLYYGSEVVMGRGDNVRVFLMYIFITMVHNIIKIHSNVM